jgi:Cu/Ag efflux protein CusF
MKGVFAALTATVVAGSLVWASGTMAQMQTPSPTQAAPGAAAPGAMEKQVEGQIKSVDPSGKKLTLADGTELTIPTTVKVTRTELQPGTSVKVAYEEQGGAKVIKHLEVVR